MTPKDPTNDRLPVDDCDCMASGRVVHVCPPPGEKEERIICPFCGDGLVYKDSLAANTQVWIMELQATISALTQRNEELVEAVKKAREAGETMSDWIASNGVGEIFEASGTKRWLEVNEELDALLSQTLATPETKENPEK